MPKVKIRPKYASDDIADVMMLYNCTADKAVEILDEMYESVQIINTYNGTRDNTYAFKEQDR